MEETKEYKKIIYSLNMLAFLKMKGVDYILDVADNLCFGLIDDSVENNFVIDEYKASGELQTFLHSYQSLRNEIKDIRNKV